MDLYFTEGADLSNTEVLVQAAADVGLDPAQVRADLAGDKDIAEIGQEVQSAFFAVASAIRGQAARRLHV
jgi:predicted DsbA family dithiol-disulfide isomerase